MKEKLPRKIHFETIVDVSSNLVDTVFGKKGSFCDVIDEIDSHISQFEPAKKYKAFIHDNSCRIYLDEMYKKIRGKSIYEGEDINSVRAAFWEIYLPYLFSRYGKKIFRLSTNLLHMLTNTDFKKIDSFFIELPYKCIYIAIPKEFKLLNTFNLPIDGFYVALLKDNEVNYTGLSPEYHHFQNAENAENVKSLMIVAVSNVILPKDDPRESLYYWHVILKEGDIFEQINRYTDKWMEKVGLADKNIDRNFIVNIFSFVINTILYINSSNTILTEKKIKVSNVSKIKNKKKKKKALQRTKMSYYPLGTDIIIDHHFQKVINLTQRKEKDYQRHIKKWMVRGHWRNQAVGTKRTKRKLIWIQPYIKGDELSDINTKDYTVK